MRKNFLSVILLFAIAFNTSAQKTNSLKTEDLKFSNESFNKNLHLDGSAEEPIGKSAKVLYAELGGPGLASINYDMRLQKKEDGIGFRVGVGGYSVGSNVYGDKESVLFVPVGLNYLLGKDQKHYFELGIGYTYVKEKSTYNYNYSGDFTASFGNLTFGYRIAPAKGGFFFKAEITPVFGKDFFIPYYGGVGFGYKF